jgi:transposase-like protein
MQIGSGLKFISEADPAAQWTAAKGGPAIFANSDNYLIDLRSAVIVDVEASRSVRQAEVGAAKIMMERTAQRFGLKPDRLAADTAYGSAEMLNWLAEERKIAPHVPVTDKSARRDGTFAKADFRYDGVTVIERQESGGREITLGLELSIKPTITYRWRDLWRQGGTAALRGKPRPRTKAEALEPERACERQENSARSLQHRPDLVSRSAAVNPTGGQSRRPGRYASMIW